MSQPCCACGEKVFPAEKLVLNGKHFHKLGCAKCGLCGVPLTAKNLLSVSSDDKAQWTCTAHRGAATTTLPGNSVPRESPLNSLGLPGVSPAKPMAKTSSAAAERFAIFLKSNVKAEENKRLGGLGSRIRASMRKQVTKDAITSLTVERQRDLAAFVEEIRKENQSPSPSTTKQVIPQISENPSRMNRLVKSIRLGKPGTATVAKPGSFTKPVVPSGQAKYTAKPNRLSIKNFRVREARAIFQKS